jgi:Tfp pilus assembly protein PilF
MNIMLFQAYNQKHDMASAVPVLAAAAQSQYATSDQKKVWLKNIALYYFQEKDYNKALDAANEAVKTGLNDSEMLNLIAKSQYLLGKYKEAAATMQEVVNKQEKPDEESLKLLWQFDLKANDQAGAARTVEKLVAYYPKPEYWANALASLVNADTKDAHLQLNVYRLMNDVGVLKRGGDFAEMADIALDEGYPGETQSVLQKAFAENVFTEQRDKDRYQHLLDGAKQRAAIDLAALPKTEQDAANAPTGDRLVQVGAAYLSYGQTDKAVAAISKGIAKGSLKYPEEANLLLGIAQLRSHNAAEAQRAFEKVGASSNTGYARLGKLWALHAGAKSA